MVKLGTWKDTIGTQLRDECYMAPSVRTFCLLNDVLDRLHKNSYIQYMGYQLMQTMFTLQFECKGSSIFLVLLAGKQKGVQCWSNVMYLEIKPPSCKQSHACGAAFFLLAIYSLNPILKIKSAKIMCCFRFQSQNLTKF
jgi:hypothetical protein